jgi:hypothetical protein
MMSSATVTKEPGHLPLVRAWADGWDRLVVQAQNVGAGCRAQARLALVKRLGEGRHLPLGYVGAGASEGGASLSI